MVEVIEGTVIHSGVSYVVSEVITELAKVDEERLIGLKVCREIFADNDAQKPMTNIAPPKAPVAKKAPSAKPAARKKTSATKATAAKKPAAVNNKDAEGGVVSENSLFSADDAEAEIVAPVNLELNLDDFIKAPTKGS